MSLEDQSIKNILISEIDKKHVRPSLLELLENPPNYPVTSFMAGIKTFFCSPHRIKIFRGKIRILFAPILNLIILFTKILKNNKINKI